MDIKLPSDLGLTAATKAAGNALNLKLNQVLEAKVIGTQIMLDTLALKVADKEIQVRTQQPLNLESGQTLQLQVVKLLPVVEFKILANASSPSPRPSTTAGAETATLKLLSVQTQFPAGGKPALNQPPVGLQIPAVIVATNGNKATVQLSFAPPDTSQPSTTRPSAYSSPLTVTLDAKQLLFPGGTNDEPNSPLKFTQQSLLALAPGTRIDLQVLKSGDTPIFSVSLPATNSDQRIVELYKQLLPIQTSSASLFNHLTRMLPALEAHPTATETLKQLAREILRAIPLNTQLIEPLRLRQSVDQSGLFLESKLAEALSGKEGIALQQDIKLKLLKFAQLLNLEIEPQTQQPSSLAHGKLLEELMQKTHGALAKLTLDQFQSLPRDDSPKLGWALDLPFFHANQAESARIEIELDKQAPREGEQKNWAVSITITPPDLATIHCRISCYDGSVNTRFWSDAAETVEKISTHLDYLKQQFEQKGLKTGFMEAQQGKPTPTNLSKKPLSQLLSEKA